MASRVFTVPNQLTFLRLGILPFFVVLIFYEQYAWGLLILVLAAATDGMDGLLARSLNQKTALGAYLDPIADKLLLSSSFVVLALEGRIPRWLTILVIGRDVLILVTATVILLVSGYRQFPPTVYGKITTGAQILMVLVVLLAEVFPQPALQLTRQLLAYVVAGFTIFSGFHYSVVIARRLHHHG
jgi:cardiolipin synthase (CMP-forming)